MTESTRTKLTLRLQNPDCENEAASVRRVMASAKGVRDVEVRPSSAVVTLWFDPSEATPEALKQQLAAAGYPPVERGAKAEPPWRNANGLRLLGASRPANDRKPPG